MTKKRVLFAALAVMLIAIISVGTLAWYNSTDSVENTFKFDDTNTDGTPDFEIEVFETKEDGTETDAKVYEDIIPNGTYAKDPTVRNKGDYDMYARLIVTVSDAKVWMDAAAKYGLTAVGAEDTILEKLVDLNAKWVRYDNVEYDATADTLTYVYYYNEIIAQKGGLSAKLFTEVTIPSQLQTEDLNLVDDQFTISIKGDAIQSDNVPVDNVAGTVNDAYKAFVAVNWAAGADYE